MSINVKVTETPDVDLTISSATGVNVGVGGTAHNSLIGLQGGTTGEYYHLTAAEYSALSLSADDYVNITGAETISGVKTFASGLVISASSENITITGNLIDGNRKLFVEAESLIVGGDNSVNSLNSAVLLGSGNSIYGDADVIVGGVGNTISGRSDSSEFAAYYNFIGAGEDLEISNSSYSSIVGGFNNKIIRSSYQSFIGGGTGNTLEASRTSFIAGGINNTINSAESVQIFGSYVTGSTSYNGYTYLADNDNRQKTPTRSDALFIDFTGGVDIKTGTLAVAEDITMGGETVATQTWVEERDLGQRFDTFLQSSIDEMFVEFPTAFSAAPIVQCELQIPDSSERTYFIAVRSITTSGFYVEFSDNIGAGYTLQTRAIPNT